MAEVAGGRFTMGLGASSQPVVERWNGVTYEKPYARTRDVLRFLKRALDGEKIDEAFETFEVHGFKLVATRHRAAADPARGAAPGMLRLAGREADGAILNWLGAERRRDSVAPRSVRARSSPRGSSSCPPRTPTPRASSGGG